MLIENGHPELTGSNGGIMLHDPLGAWKGCRLHNHWNNMERSIKGCKSSQLEADNFSFYNMLQLRLKKDKWIILLTVQCNQDLRCNSQNKETLARIGIAQAGIFTDHSNTSPHCQQEEKCDLAEGPIRTPFKWIS